MNLIKNIKRFVKENLVFLILILFVVLINTIKIPYDVEMPGGLIDLTDRVTVDGKLVKTKGSFNMAYVGMAQGSIPYVLLGLINPDWDVIKQEENTYEGETIEEAYRRNRLYLEESKIAAFVSALREAGIEYEITNKKNNVLYIDKKAKTDLEVGDYIISVNNKEIDDVNEIIDIVSKSKIGKKINIVVNRSGKKVNCYATIVDIEGEPKIGIVSLTTFDVDSKKKIYIDTKASESGPSGGLMMSLMIYNAIMNKDITNGKKIVGTGTIDKDGNVGEIGGVKYKLMGAVKEKADLFFVPKENYKEAIEVKKDKGYDIKVIKVTTLKEAIKYLEGEK